MMQRTTYGPCHSAAEIQSGYSAWMFKGVVICARCRERVIASCVVRCMDILIYTQPTLSSETLASTENVC